MGMKGQFLLIEKLQLIKVEGISEIEITMRTPVIIIAGKNH